MIKASIDRAKFEKSLKRFSREFGDTNAQALCRWGVQVCRELAGSTQVFGRTAEAKRKQWNAIEAGARTIVNIVGNVKQRKSRMITTVEELSQWIDSNRGAKGHTKSVPISQRPFVTEALFQKTLKQRRKAAGIAKGGWIGAGQTIAAAQKGTDRISIGKNFLGYAQKHAHFGKAVKPRAGFFPKAELTNTARHTTSPWVMKPRDFKTAADWGLKKTVTWYRSALRRQNQTQKP